MEWILILFIVVVLFSAFIKPTSTVKGHNYRQRAALFTAAERSFLGVLDLATSEKYQIFCKVRVADILTPSKTADRGNWQRAFNKISAKHFDYVLCTKETLSVVAVIELDDKSHKKEKSIARDILIEKACSSAGLKLVRFETKARYNIQEVRERLETSLNLPNSGDIQT